jgi:hypothetical protein
MRKRSPLVIIGRASLLYVAFCAAFAGTRVAMPATVGESHRVAVDGIEEGTARVELDGSEIVTVPASLLPAGTREGDVLTLTLSIEAR